MHRKSNFGIRVNFEKSYESYVFDKNTNSYFLDFFGNYSSQPLGWNHPVFSSGDFKNEMLRVMNHKISLNEYITDEGEEFLRLFEKRFPNKNWKSHFCCTGSLAVEAAIKTAFEYKRNRNGKVLTIVDDFHGIYGYSSSLSTSSRIGILPYSDWILKIDSPAIQYNTPNEELNEYLLQRYISEIEEYKRKYSTEITALLIEPIQCTNGDRYFSNEFFKINREFCDTNDVVLIHDEVQTGFGGTGKFWYSDYHAQPDIIVFGKKAQTAGILVSDKFQEIFKYPESLEVTFDGDLLDMIRCKYILRTYDTDDILYNVRTQGDNLYNELKRIEEIKNVRHAGLLVAFDVNNRDKLYKQFVKNKLLTLKGGIDTIRLRPSLNVKTFELNDSIIKIKKSMEEV